MLPVPSPFQERLDDYRTALAGSAPETPAHITLVPPLEVPEVELTRAVEHLGGVASQFAAFPIQLRGTGTFRPTTPVVYIEVALGASACTRLATLVGAGPLSAPAAFPYHPHVTIAHRLSEDELDAALSDCAGFDAGWTAQEFTLYEHGPSGWSATRTFPLDG